MWKAVVGHDVSVKVEAQGDDWDTDPDFVVSAWDAPGGSMALHNPTLTCPVSVPSIHQLRSKVSEEHEVIKKKELETGPKASYGYGGKFGTERDRMDKCAVGHEYVADVGKHSSQTDAAQGFGGKFGVQRDRADKSALGFEYKVEVEKHSSQTGKSMGKGFGGRYGVERDKVDKAAVGFDYKSQAEKHDSQKDYAKGFGGRYGVQKDRVDKSAAGFDEMAAPTSSYEKTTPLEAAASGTSSLRSRFEHMARSAEEQSRRRAREAQPRHSLWDASQGTGMAPSPCVCLPSHLVLFLHSGAEPVHSEAPQTLLFGAAPPLSSVCQCPAPEETCRSWNRLEDEEAPPTLPPRPADLGTELCKVPSQDQPLYCESLDVGGDYEELPEPSDYCDSTSGGAEYEELPAPVGKLDAVYDLAEDGGHVDSAGQGPGTCAVALYDYQGEGDDEISFDPDDTITHIEMVDEGWWRGQCHGRFGLFPANYVKLLQ
ncbi:HCLS1 protein, partial [Calyptomena viridis]|nr:HCLS1 protein [Calyptomena viridis]